MKNQNKPLIIIEGGIAAGATQADEDAVEILDIDNISEGDDEEVLNYFESCSPRAQKFILDNTYGTRIKTLQTSLKTQINRARKRGL